MRVGDYFVFVLMTLNIGAAMSYAWYGFYWNSLYWLAAMTLNLCLLQLK